MTEEQQSGTGPDSVANIAGAETRPDQSGAAVAVADEPVEADGAARAEETAARAGDSANGAVSPSDGQGTTTASGDVDGSNPASDSRTATPATVADAEAPSVDAEAAVAESQAPEPSSAAEAPAEADAPAAIAGDDVPVAATPTDAAAQAPAAEAAGAATTGSQLDVSDTADAPAAGEEDEPEPPRDLGPEPTTMEELLAEQDSDIKSFKHGDVVEGTVVRIDKDEILVDIGAKSEGVVSNRELYGRHAESQPQLTIGDTVLVYVLQPESQEGHAVLSLRRAGLERKWRSMQEQFESGVIIEAPVIDHNKGGLIVDCGIRGFVPISQIVDFPRRPQNDQPRDAAQEIAEKLMPFVGRKLRLKILEVNRKANRLILSEKVALYEERREKRDELFSSLQVGQKVTGTVRSIAPFGVFIDLGGIDGLVHKSELSWNKVNNPEAGYKVGEEVEAEVIDINHERGRISLSIRRLQPDPWHSTVADFNVGDVIDGTVTKLVNFGAFVRVRDGLEGLIHISELSHQRVVHPGDVVHEGQQLKLKIISLDSERHRLGLSLKQAEEPPARPAPEPGEALAGAGPRPERRPRPERSYSMSDAVQEPEGGIDNTLAAAFAQVRDQLAASEEAQSEVPEAPAAMTEAPPAEVAGEAESAAADVSGPTGAAVETAAEPQPEVTTAEQETAQAEPAQGTAEAEPAEAAAEPHSPEATTTDAQAEVPAEAADADADGPEATATAPADDTEPAVESVAETEPEAAAPVAEVAAEPVVSAPADADTEPEVAPPDESAEAAPVKSKSSRSAKAVSADAEADHAKADDA